MTEFTAHFRLPVPDFNQEPWHDQFRDLCFAIDTMAYEALLANASAWANSTAYAIGQIVLDETNGSLYVCAIAHTSPPFPTTFLTFRTLNPTFWNPTVQLPVFRGTWTTATTYIVGDFVIDNNRYAVCVVSHVSTTFNADLGAGKWSVLIDLTAINVGINGLTEASIAAAPTVNLGVVATTQVLISGSGATITSFGTSPERFKILRFDGVNIIQNNATSLILRGQGARNTVAGDIMFVRSDNVGNWRELYYWTDATEADTGIIAIATNPVALAGANDLTAITPLKAHQIFTNRFDTYFPAGVRVLMQQTTPPTGWTKSVAHNDKALRVVSGAAVNGGVNSFSTTFDKTGTSDFTLSTAHIPSHSHGTSGNGISGGESQDHTHSEIITTSVGTAVNQAGIGVHNGTAGTTGANNRGHTHTIGAQGGGAGHAHALDIRVQFMDVIVAVRN